MHKFSNNVAVGGLISSYFEKEIPMAPKKNYKPNEKTSKKTSKKKNETSLGA